MDRIITVKVIIACINLNADTVFPLQVFFHQIGLGCYIIGIEAKTVKADAVAQIVGIVMILQGDASVCHNDAVDHVVLIVLGFQMGICIFVACQQGNLVKTGVLAEMYMGVNNFHGL